MSFEAEHRMHDNPPTLEQLRSLAAIGVKSAISRERFKSLKRTQGVHYFIDELDLLMDSVEEQDLPTQIRHRMAVRIGVRPPEDRIEKVWSLKYFDTYFVEAPTNEAGTVGPTGEASTRWQGERSTYRFEWTRSRVLMADRTLKLVGFEEPHDNDLEYALEHFKVRDDAASILQVSEELRTVTADDCNELIRDMSEYFSVIDAVEQR